VKIWAWTTTWWNDADDARLKGDGPFGLKVWLERVEHYFNPRHCFLACGTWSDPDLSPLPFSVQIVNAGIPAGTTYDIHYTQLAGCALSAGMAYALNHAPAWDLLIILDNDILVGAVDFDALLREFLVRDELLLSPSWWDGVGGPFMAWKREGAIRTLHGRLRPNLMQHPADANAPKPQLIEEELAALFKGRWWNPWPQFRINRQDYGQNPDAAKLNAEALTWPFVRLPHPDIIEEYTRTQTALAKPVRS
jgi:hypothetical protein